MHLFSALLLGLAANLDNFGIGVSYGIQKVRIPILSNFFIAILSFVVTALADIAGHQFSHVIGWANVIGALLIIGIGAWVSLHKSESNVLEPSIPVSTKTYSVPLKPLSCTIQIIKNPSAADIDANGFISGKEAVALGLTLSFNCIGTGIGAGLTGMEPISLACSVFIFSLLCISAGYWTGWKTASNRLERWSQVISGVLLMLIGIYELFN